MIWLADVLIGTESHDWRARAERNLEQQERQTKTTGTVRRTLARLAATWREQHDRRVAAQHLGRLNDHLLHDIGISRFDIDAHVSGERKRQTRVFAPRSIDTPTKTPLVANGAAAKKTDCVTSNCRNDDGNTPDRRAA